MYLTALKPGDVLTIKVPSSPDETTVRVELVKRAGKGRQTRLAVQTSRRCQIVPPPKPKPRKPVPPVGQAVAWSAASGVDWTRPTEPNPNTGDE